MGGLRNFWGDGGHSQCHDVGILFMNTKEFSSTMLQDLRSVLGPCFMNCLPFVSPIWVSGPVFARLRRLRHLFRLLSSFSLLLW